MDASPNPCSQLGRLGCSHACASLTCGAVGPDACAVAAAGPSVPRGSRRIRREGTGRTRLGPLHRVRAVVYPARSARVDRLAGQGNEWC